MTIPSQSFFAFKSPTIEGPQAFFIDKDFKNILYTMDDDDSSIYKLMPDLVVLAITMETVEKVDSVIFSAHFLSSHP